MSGSDSDVEHDANVEMISNDTMVVGCKKPRLDDTFASLQRQLSRSKQHEKTLTVELEHKDYEIKVFQAIIRQYRNKFKNVRTLAMVGIDHEDILL